MGAVVPPRPVRRDLEAEYPGAPLFRCPADVDELAWQRAVHELEQECPPPLGLWDRGHIVVLDGSR